MFDVDHGDATSWSQQFGVFAARIRIKNPSRGLWPAFWMEGADHGTVGWPLDGEVDTFEAVGQQPTTIQQHIEGGQHRRGGGHDRGRVHRRHGPAPFGRIVGGIQPAGVALDGGDGALLGRVGLEAETRLRQGERLIQFMLGDLAERLKPVGRLDILDSTIAEVTKFYSQVPPQKVSPDGERIRANYRGILNELVSLIFFCFRYLPKLRRIFDDMAVPIQLFSVNEDKSPITFPACRIGEPLSPGCGISKDGKFK